VRISKKKKKKVRFSLTEPAAVKWEKSVYRERKRCFSSLFCLVSLLFGNDLSILRDELTANISPSRALDRVSSLSFFSSRERLEKEKEVRRESVCFCPFLGEEREKKFLRRTTKRRKQRRRRVKRWGREKQKIPNNERVCWPSYCEEEEEEENRYLLERIITTREEE